MSRVFAFFSTLTLGLGIACTSSLFSSPRSLANLFVFLFCLTVFTGFIALIKTASQRNRKSKKHYLPLRVQQDDARLGRILASLAPDDRDYLLSLLEAKRLGLINDGELTSIDDLQQQYKTS